MRRWGLWILLVLSLGVNLGVLLTLAVEGRPAGEAPGEGVAEVDVPEVDVPEGKVREGELLGGDAPERPRGRGMRMLRVLADRLELQGEERERFLTLQRSFLRTGGQARHRRLLLQRQLRRELTGPEPDRRRIGELIDELVSTQRTLERSLAESVLETRELLGPDRERGYLVFLERLRRRMDGPPGRGGRPGHGPGGPRAPGPQHSEPPPGPR